jgi:hypothetical protein
VVPIHAAPVPAGPLGAEGDYGRSWPAASGVPAAHDPAGAHYLPPAAQSYPAGGYAAGGYGSAADYPAAAYSGSPYDQSAYLPADPAAGQQDQNGYGTPDSGYGAGAYGGYPGY